MKWFFEIPGNMHYIEIDGVQDSGGEPDYDYYFRDRISSAACDGTNVWFREGGKNHLVWQCVPQKGSKRQTSKDDDEGYFILCNTIEYHEFALKLLRAVIPLWEPMTGDLSVLERVMQAQSDWVESKISNAERNAARNTCARAAKKLADVPIPSIHNAVSCFCKPDDEEGLLESLDRIMKLTKFDFRVWQERTWAEVFVRRFEGIEKPTKGQRLALRRVKQIVRTSKPDTSSERIVTGLWHDGMSPESVSLSVLPLARSYCPDIFFATSGRTEKVCNLERVIHEFRIRTLELLMCEWTTSSKNRDDAINAIHVYQQWLAGDASAEKFAKTARKLKKYLKRSTAKADGSASETRSKEERLVADCLSMAISEVNQELSSFPTLYHLMLREAHAIIIGEITDEEVEDDDDENQDDDDETDELTTLDRELTRWLVPKVIAEIESTGRQSIVKKAAIEHLQAELESL